MPDPGQNTEAKDAKEVLKRYGEKRREDPFFQLSFADYLHSHADEDFRGRRNFDRGDFSVQDLRLCILDGLSFVEAIFVGSNFQLATLKGSNIEGADLSGAENVTSRMLLEAHWEELKVPPDDSYLYGIYQFALETKLKRQQNRALKIEFIRRLGYEQLSILLESYQNDSACDELIDLVLTWVLNHSSNIKDTVTIVENASADEVVSSMGNASVSIRTPQLPANEADWRGLGHLVQVAINNPNRVAGTVVGGGGHARNIINETGNTSISLEIGSQPESSNAAALRAETSSQSSETVATQTEAPPPYAGRQSGQLMPPPLASPEGDRIGLDEFNANEYVLSQTLSS